MAEPQPPASLMVGALRRRVQAAGGFATVLVKGSAFGSALLIVTRSDGETKAFEKIAGLDDGSGWRLGATGDSDVAQFIARQQRFDPDIWVLELDVPAAERFIAASPEIR